MTGSRPPFEASTRTLGGRAIAAAFARAAAEGRSALVGYWPAGYPTMARSEEALEALAEGGCDVIEVGVPFSDPVADGPILQEAAAEAIKNGSRLSFALEVAGRIRRRTGVPTLIMSYYNPLLQFGEERLAGELAARGVDGVIVADLPVEECEPLVGRLQAHQRAWVALVAPTSRARLMRIVQHADGFVYVVSRTGVTGMAAGLPPEALELVRALREATDLPAAVGFGVSSPDQAAALREADGVVVGSAFVDAYRRALSASANGAAAVRSLAFNLRRALVRN